MWVEYWSWSRKFLEVKEFPRNRPGEFLACPEQECRIGLGDEQRPAINAGATSSTMRSNRESRRPRPIHQVEGESAGSETGTTWK